MTQRAVSTTVGYVMALAVASLLVTGLLIAGTTFVDNQRERVIEQELDVIGQHLAGNIEQVDRMVRAAGGAPDTARINQTFNSHVTGSSYSVRLVDATQPHLLLNSTNPDVSARVNVTSETSVSDSFANGGDLAVRYTSTGEIEVANA